MKRNGVLQRSIHLVMVLCVLRLMAWPTRLLSPTSSVILCLQEAFPGI